MLRRVAVVRINFSGELSASFIRATRIGELGTTLAVTSNRRTLRRNIRVRRLLVTAGVVPSSPILVTLMKEALRSCETSILTRATQRKDAILQDLCYRGDVFKLLNHRLKSGKFLFNVLAKLLEKDTHNFGAFRCT
jgi:hypothetical protein